MPKMYVFCDATSYLNKNSAKAKLPPNPLVPKRGPVLLEYNISRKSKDTDLIEAKISSNNLNTSTTTVSLHSSKIQLNSRLYLSLLRCFLLQLWFRLPMMT
ncbi:hypothetical protein ACTXT7_013744 [Hymenolepis weldensis]